MTNNRRFTCLLPSEADAIMLHEYARVHGRSVGNLAARLLEEALLKDLRDGLIPQLALDKRDAFIAENANKLGLIE